MSAGDNLKAGLFNASVNNLNVNGTLLIDGSPIPGPPMSTTILTSVSGIWTAGVEPITMSLSLVSGGTAQNLVFCTIGGVIDQADAATFITGPTIPVGYRPSSDLTLPIMVLDNDVEIAGVFNVVPGGSTTIEPANSDAVFQGTGFSGYSTSTFTWTTNA